MKLMDTELEGKVVDLGDLDLIMEELGFNRGAWDYKRATFDYKYMDKSSSIVYYLRIPAELIEGMLENHSEAALQLKTPYIGRHIYPHGFDYEGEIPNHILNSAKNKLNELNQHILPDRQPTN